MDTWVFTGYAGLPQDAARQPLYNRLGVIVEVDAAGCIQAAEATLAMQVGRDFFDRLIKGKSVITEREEIVALIWERYLGSAQGALVNAMQRVFEAVDRSALVTGVAAGRHEGGGEHAV
jgi:hypothetical protein